MNDSNSLLILIGILISIFSAISSIIIAIFKKNGTIKVSFKLDYLDLNPDICSNIKILEFLEPYSVIIKPLNINSHSEKLQLLIQNETESAIFINTVIIKLAFQKNLVFEKYHIKYKTFKHRIQINGWIRAQKSLCMDIIPTDCIPIAKIICVISYQESRNRFSFRYKEKLKFRINNIDS